jgi:glycosyltransferase involved in cell wall biosynthesis
MKILQVMAGAEHGGAETAFVDMCIAMHEAGENIEVVTRPNKIRVPKMQAAGIKVHTLPFGSLVDVFTPWAIQRIIQKFKPDIIQTWMSRAPLKVLKWNAKMDVPRYLVVARLGSPYKLKYFKETDYFVTITPAIRDYMMEGGFAPERIHHINNFAEVEQAGEINRADFGTPEHVPLLLGLGRLHDDKAFDTLIKIAARLPEVHVWIAGEGPDRGALEKMIRDLDLQERVKLIGWQTDRAGLLQEADICMFISRNEGFGTVFVQAWAQKTPIIVSDADGPRQFVRDGEDGLMCAIDDVEAFCDAVRKILDDREFAQRLTENGYKRYKAAFTKEASLQNYLQWYYTIREREHLPPAG